MTPPVRFLPHWGLPVNKSAEKWRM